jgi:hypothetical protein
MTGGPARNHRHSPRLQHPSQGPFSQQQHPQSAQVHTPVTQQPQQSQSGQGVFSPAEAGVRAKTAHSRIADMIVLLEQGIWKTKPVRPRPPQFRHTP